MKKLFTRYQIRKIVTLFTVLVGVAVLYGWLVEPSLLTVKCVPIQDASLHQAWGNLRLVHISDLHLHGWSKRVRELARKINSLHPDIICVTGDLGQWDTKETGVIKFLNELHPKVGTYVVLGDSDMASGPVRCFYCHIKNDIHRLRSQPKFFRDTCTTVRLHGKALSICGISPKTGERPHDVLAFWQKKVRQKFKNETPILVLSHFSGAWSSLPQKEKVLWLSGNTHGGQIWMPNWLMKVILKGKDTSHIKGLFNRGEGNWLYVNPGLGTTRGFPIRIGVPPEITFIEIKPFKKAGPSSN